MTAHMHMVNTCPYGLGMLRDIGLVWDLQGSLDRIITQNTAGRLSRFGACALAYIRTRAFFKRHTCYSLWTKYENYLLLHCFFLLWVVINAFQILSLYVYISHEQVESMTINRPASPHLINHYLLPPQRTSCDHTLHFTDPTPFRPPTIICPFTSRMCSSLARGPLAQHMPGFCLKMTPLSKS